MWIYVTRNYHVLVHLLLLQALLEKLLVQLHESSLSVQLTFNMWQWILMILFFWLLWSSLDLFLLSDGHIWLTCILLSLYMSFLDLNDDRFLNFWYKIVFGSSFSRFWSFPNLLLYFLLLEFFDFLYFGLDCLFTSDSNLFGLALFFAVNWLRLLIFLFIISVFFNLAFFLLQKS